MKPKKFFFSLIMINYVAIAIVWLTLSAKMCIFIKASIMPRVHLFDKKYSKNSNYVKYEYNV